MATHPVLALADDVELLGVYGGSGLREPPYLIRRPDGQVVQVSRLVFLVAMALDEAHDLGQLAARVTGVYGREVSAENVAYLLEHKLRAAGLIHGPALPAATLDRPRPLLALRLRIPLVPARAHRVVTRALTPLFWPPVVASALVALLVLDSWLLLSQRHTVVAALGDVVYRPQLLLVLSLLTILAGVFHELGHAAAARYGGAQPGAMGAGVYLVWPVFYTDVTDSYRLSRRGRLRTDLGGVYFNAWFALAVTGAHSLTGFRPLLLFVVLAHVETARQFLPFVRLDGYYVVSDLAGVPNLFAYMRPVLTSLLPWHDGPARQAARVKLDELTPRARRLVTGWVCLTAPVLLVNLVMLLVLAPRLAGAAVVSAAGQLATLRVSAALVDPVGVVYGAVGLALLALPVAGIGFVVVRSARHLARGARAWWQARPATTAAIGAVAASLVALQVGLVWPDAFATALRHGRPRVPNGPRAELAGPIIGDALSSPPSPMVKPSPTTATESAAGEPATTARSGSPRSRSPEPAGPTGTTSAGATTVVGATAPGPEVTGSPAPTSSAAPASSTTAPAPGRRGGRTTGDDTTSTTGAPPSPASSTTTRPPPPPGRSTIGDVLDELFPH